MLCAMLSIDHLKIIFTGPEDFAAHQRVVYRLRGYCNCTLAFASGIHVVSNGTEDILE
jgi:hypothetical protein